MHCDIRWPNIVRTRKGEWFVIDCTEFAHRTAECSVLSKKSETINSNYVYSTTAPWSPRFDYYQLGKLIREALVDIGDTDLDMLSLKLIDKGTPEVNM